MNIVKELFEILKEMPDLAVWILVGVLFYKVVIIGSIFGVVKMLIEKTHNVFKIRNDGLLEREKAILKKAYEETLRKEVNSYQHEYTLDGEFITSDKTYNDFKNLIRTIKSSDSNYVHQSDVRFLWDAYHEKKERDAK